MTLTAWDGHTAAIRRALALAELGSHAGDGQIANASESAEALHYAAQVADDSSFSLRCPDDRLTQANAHKPWVQNPLFDRLYKKRAGKNAGGIETLTLEPTCT